MGPEKRRVPLQLFTPAGWMAGTLHVPAKSRLLEHVNHAKEFISLTDVRFPSKPEPLPFFAVQKEAITLLVPPPGEVQIVPGTEELVSHRLSCMLAQGTLYGVFRILKGIRVSDYLSAARGFVVLEDCDLWLSDRFGRSVSEEHRPQVLVNMRSLIGVTEEG